MASDSYTLAGTDLTVPPLGVGTWAWGDRSTWGMGGYDPTLTEISIKEAWDASIDAGVTLFDTAEVYGSGESERIIGRLVDSDPARAEKAVIATKFMPSPWKLNVHGALLSALRRSLVRLGVRKVGLYQIHGPISLRSHAALAEALATAHQSGLVDAVGVSELLGQGDPEYRNRAAKARRAARHQPDRVLSPAPRAGDDRLARGVRGAGRAPARLLADRPGSPDRQVLRFQPTAGEAGLQRSSDGGGRRGRRGAPVDRREARRQAPEPGGPQLDHRQGCRAHPGRQEPPTGRGERGRTRMEHRRGRPRASRSRRTAWHPEPAQPVLAARLSSVLGHRPGTTAKNSAARHLGDRRPSALRRTLEKGRVAEARRVIRCLGPKRPPAGRASDHSGQGHCLGRRHDGWRISESAGPGSEPVSGATLVDTTCPERTDSSLDGATCVGHGF